MTDRPSAVPAGPRGAAAPLLVGAAAFLAGLPGLAFPFLAEDWPTFAAAGQGSWLAGLFGYYRPAYMATFRIETRLWGASPALAHLVSLLLVAACAALVVVLARRYTGDPWLATAGGLLFALHPWHVENAAWVAARADQLWALFALLAALAYDRWRSRADGVPVLALLLFEAALLSKESAVVAAPAILLIGLLDPARRPSRRELARGHLPMMALAAAHLLLVRPLALGGGTRALAQGLGASWLGRIPGYAAGAVLPLDVELLAARPLLWGGLAGAAIGALLLGVRLRAGRLPRTALGAGVLFFVLIAPSLVGFQERYLFLAAAASGAFLASLLRALGRRPAVVAAVLLAAVWMPALASQWQNWREAATASRSLLEGLAQASLRPGVEEIVVANLPFRVRGGSVFVWGEFRDALALSGGRPVPVRGAAFVSYRNATDDALESAQMPGSGTAQPPDGRSAKEAPFEVRLRIVEGPFSHYNGPGSLRAGGRFETPAGTVVIEGGGRVRIGLAPLDGGRRAGYVWRKGRLEPLF